jgi:AcrR family transcriptional regulator
MNAATSAPTKKGKATQARVFDAALELINERGFEQATVAGICEKAGISNGAFYHHFKSKQDVLLGYVRNESAELLEYYQSLPKQPFVEALHAVLDWQIKRYLIKGPQFIAHLYSGIMLSRRDLGEVAGYSLTPVLADCIRRGQDAGELRGDIDATAMAVTLFSVIYSVTAFWCAGGGDADLKSNLAFCLEPLLKLYSAIK